MSRYPSTSCSAVRRTGLSTRFAVTVMAVAIVSALVRSPPEIIVCGAPNQAHALAIPRPKCATQADGGLLGMASDTLTADGTAPMAFMSERFWAASFHPVEYPLSRMPEGHRRN